MRIGPTGRSCCTGRRGLLGPGRFFASEFTKLGVSFNRDALIRQYKQEKIYKCLFLTREFRDISVVGIDSDPSVPFSFNHLLAWCIQAKVEEEVVAVRLL